MYCDHCGASIGSTSQFCTQCGNRVLQKSEGRPKTSPQAPRGRKKSSPKILIVSIFFVLFTFLGLVAFWTLSTDELSEARKILSKAAQSGEAIEEPLSKALTLVEIGQAQGDSGDRSSALITLTKARQAASGIKDDLSKTGPVAVIAARQAHFGDKRSAETAMKEILLLTLAPNDDLRKQAVMGVAYIQAATGDLSDAFARLDGLRESSAEIGALLWITVQQVKTGRVAEALQTATPIGDPALKAYALNFIAIAKAKKGDRQSATAIFQQALALADGVSDRATKSAILLLIAQAQGEAGDKKSALLTIQEAIKTGVEPREDYQKQNLAIAYASSGEIRNALEIASTIEKVYEKAAVLLRVAVVQAREGNVKEALQTASKIALADTPFSCRGIAEALAKTGDAKAAIEWASKLTSPSSKAYALLGIAEGILERKLGRPYFDIIIAG